MKKLVIISFTILCSLSLFSQNITVVFSQNKCGFDIEELNKFWTEQAVPILNDLVAQEKLIGWGVLTHAWGDEWNWNVYYTAASQNAFNDAWSEFIKIMMEKDPETFKTFSKFCFEHKDSIYTQIMSSDDTDDVEDTDGN